MIATVTKKFVEARTEAGGRVHLHGGTELDLERIKGGYRAKIVSGQEEANTLLLTEFEAGAWLVFRTAKSLGYTTA